MKKFWKNFWLRARLFKIWFLKNILLFLQIALMVCLICTFLGCISAETPILGKTVYPMFKPLVDEVRSAVEKRNLDNFTDILAAIVSIITSVGTFCLKAKNITQSDIKSRKLKMDIISAGLYFDGNGKLVKKVEKMTKTDINGDGKIDDEDIDENDETVNKGLFNGGLINAAREFALISTAKFSEDDEKNKETYKKVLSDADLKQTAEASKEVKDATVETAVDMLEDNLPDVVDNEVANVAKAEDITDEVKAKKISFMIRLKESVMDFIKKFRKKKEEEEKETTEEQQTEAEVITNNVEKDEEKKVVVQEVKKEEKVASQPAKVEAKKPEPKTDKNVEDFLAKLRASR